jgi:hypothetical protein
LDQAHVNFSGTQSATRYCVILPPMRERFRTVLRFGRFGIQWLYFCVLVLHFKFIQSPVWKYPQAGKFKSGLDPQLFIV